ncbi:MAG: TniB family NTP-binding protein [Tabrizicola sp.]|nr:TniB family NTP-binding protein [Tabrizicola sp.]
MRAETVEDGRIALIQSDIWIGFPRAEQVLDRLQGLIDMHVLAAVGAPSSALSLRAQSVASLEVRVVGLLRDLGLRMIMIDEVHNLLAGTHREQRRFLNVLRYLSNELEASLVCFGVSEAVDAIRGDVQLARRLDEHHLPNWRDDAEFSDMIQTLIAAMPLAKKSNLKVKSLKQILALTGGVTSRIFSLVKDLSIDAIVTGQECITDDAVAKWTPVWSRHASAQRRLEKARA